MQATLVSMRSRRRLGSGQKQLWKVAQHGRGVVVVVPGKWVL